MSRLYMMAAHEICPNSLRLYLDLRSNTGSYISFNLDMTNFLSFLRFVNNFTEISGVRRLFSRNCSTLNFSLVPCCTRVVDWPYYIWIINLSPNLNHSSQPLNVYEQRRCINVKSSIAKY